MLVDEAILQVQTNDRIGLVGRNGAGKTTLMRVLAGGARPPAERSPGQAASVIWLQDPEAADPDQSVRARLLSARDLDQIELRMRAAEKAMASADDATRDKAMRRYERAEQEFVSAGGYGGTAEAAAVAAGLGIDDRMMASRLGDLSGGQRRRVELARLLFAEQSTLLLDEPTNHLDADSISWLRGFLQAHTGGLVVISHDVDLLADVVNKVAFLDADRLVLDHYNLGWHDYLKARETDERRRRRERANADKTAATLTAQAEKMRAKATKARAARNECDAQTNSVTASRSSSVGEGSRLRFRPKAMRESSAHSDESGQVLRLP